MARSGSYPDDIEHPIYLLEFRAIRGGRAELQSISVGTEVWGVELSSGVRLPAAQ